MNIDVNDPLRSYYSSNPKFAGKTQYMWKIL